MKTRSKTIPCAFIRRPAALRFLDSGGAQIHVPPSSEQVLEVPFALTMAQQDEETIGGHGNSPWLEIDERL